jgi:hypothetical protein
MDFLKSVCVLAWRVDIVCVCMECGNCVCWNGVWKLCVLEWRVEIVCVGMEGGNCVLEWIEMRIRMNMVIHFILECS